MSQGVGISLKEATRISDEWIAKLSPLCKKISAAGTVRRQDEETAHDIDLVLIRDESKIKEFTDLIDSLDFVKGQATGKWLLRKLDDGVILDIRMATEDDWGWRLFQHTGTTDLFLFAVDKLHGLEKDFKTEEEVFVALGIQYIIPRNRFCSVSWENKATKKKENAMNWIQNLKNMKVLGEVTCEVTEVDDDKHDPDEDKKNKKKMKVAKMSMRGFIGRGMFRDGITDSKVEKLLGEIGTVDELRVTINSGGGSVFDAFSIFSQLRKFPAKIVTEIEGLAASAAAFLVEAGDERLMAENSLFMIHEASGGGFGNKGVIAKLLDVLKKVDGILENAFVKASTSNLKEVQGFMDAEEFMTAQQAKDRGFIDKISAESDAEPHIKPKQADQDAEDAVKSILERLEKDFADNKDARDKWNKLVEEISAGIPSNQAKKLTKTEEAEMVATEQLKEIQNVLKVEDSDNVLESIKDIQKQLLESKVTAAAKAKAENNGDTGLEARFAQVEKKQTELEKTNESLTKQRDLAVDQMGGMRTFQNSEILKQRRKKIQALFDPPVCKIRPAQLEDALATFVDIDPDQVEDTQELFDHSIKIWGLNISNEAEYNELQGLNPDDDDDPDKVGENESVDSLSAKIEKAVDEYKDKNKCSYEDAEKAVEISHKELYEAYEEAMAK